MPQGAQNVYIRSGGSWNIPGILDLSVRSGGSWQGVKKLWIRSGGSWHIIADYEIPKGPTPFMHQPNFSGGPVDQSWSNTSTSYEIMVHLFINGSEASSAVKSAGSTSHQWPESLFSSGDSVQGSVTYREKVGIRGERSDLSTSITYTA